MTGNDPLFRLYLLGAIMAALLLVTMTNFIAGFLYHPKGADKPGYMITAGAPAETPAAKAEAPAAPAPPSAPDAPAAPAAPESVLAMLASADADKGKKVARKCAACHSFDKGGRNKVGPPLWDIVGAKQAAASYKYSGALKGLGGTWDYAALDAFLLKPKAYAKGTKMSFAGIAKAGDRANLIEYMRSRSDNPKPLP
jgi:cytochrome c